MFSAGHRLIGVTRRFLRPLALVITLILLPCMALPFYGPHDSSPGQNPSPTQLIVKYKSGTINKTGSQIRALSATTTTELDNLRQRFAVIAENPLLPQAMVTAASDSLMGNIYLLDVDPEVDIEAMAEAYRQLDIVEYAEPDYEVELYDAPADPLYVWQWPLNNTGQPYYEIERLTGDNNDVLTTKTGTFDADIDAHEVFQNPPDNTTTVVVAIIDTGVDADHPDLDGVFWTNEDEIPDNGIDDDHNGIVDDIIGAEMNTMTNDPTDDLGHGTHCAGIVAAVADNGIGIAGVTPDARIMAVKCWPLTLSALSRGIIYAAENGADVFNMSWGGWFPMQVVYDALQFARSRGVVLVASSGNDGTERTNYPSSYPEVISVGASTANDEVAYFSTYNSHVALCAPGLSVLSLRATGTDMYGTKGEPNVHIIDDDYYVASGTSMAGPHVVAVAAYLRAVSPGLSHDRIKAIMQSSADDILDPYGNGQYYPGWDKYSGAGRVNLNAALAEDWPAVRAILDSPLDFTITSGSIDIYGSADGSDFTGYTLEYGLEAEPSSWTEIVSSATPVTDGLLGTLNSDGLSGLCLIRLRVGDDNLAIRQIFIADHAVAQFDYPTEGDTIGGYIQILGTSVCADFSLAVLEYGIGASPSSWTEISSSTAVTYDGPVASWFCATLPDGYYSLRLSTYSTSGLESADTITVFLKQPFTAPNGWSIDIGQKLSPSINYCDVDKDGQNELIVGTQSGIRIYNTDGTLQTTGLPPLPGGDCRIIPAVGRLDTDEYDDFVLISDDGKLYGYPSAGSMFQITLSETPDMNHFSPVEGLSAPRVFLKDINGDGIDEIHYFPGGNISDTRDSWYFIFNADGTSWSCGVPSHSTYEYCLPADLDGDGICEIYCYGSNLAEYDTCGNLINSMLLIQDGYQVSPSFSDMSAVDIDYDGKSELIIHGVPYGGASTESPYYVFAFDENLTMKSGWPHSMGLGFFFAPSHPVFGDLDGDGNLEYASAYFDTDFSRLNVWRIDGSPLLGPAESSGEFAVSLQSGIYTNPVIADIDDNGQSDVAVPCLQNFLPTTVSDIEEIDAFAADGKFVDRFPMVVAQSNIVPGVSYVTVGDIDNDGYLDMAYASSHNTLVFQRFPQSTWRPELAYCPMWRYNRRLNATADATLADPDGDGVFTAFDNCPNVANADQADADGDGVGDICDNCAATYNPDQFDTNGDNIGDACCCGHFTGGFTGNTDCDALGKRALADITILIDRIYLSKQPLCCEASGNVDGDQDGKLGLADVTRLIDHVYLSKQQTAACQ